MKVAWRNNLRPQAMMGGGLKQTSDKICATRAPAHSTHGALDDVHQGGPDGTMMLLTSFIQTLPTQACITLC